MQLVPTCMARGKLLEKQSCCQFDPRVMDEMDERVVTR